MSNAEQPFYRRPLWIVVAIFLAVALVGGGIAVATGVFNGRDDTTGNGAGPTSAPSSGNAIPASAESICGLKGYDTSNTLTAAPNVDWKLVGTVAAPTDPDGAGPGKQEDDGQFRTCFAHTSEGALFAAINFYAVSSNTQNAPRLYELLADGKVKDAVKEAGQAPVSDDSSRIQIAGFKVNDYSANTATIDLAIKATSEQDALLSQPLVLKWEDGDWKVVVTESGFQYQSSPLSSLGGYIPFSGV